MNWWKNDLMYSDLNHSSCWKHTNKFIFNCRHFGNVPVPDLWLWRDLYTYCFIFNDVDCIKYNLGKIKRFGESQEKPFQDSSHGAQNLYMPGVPTPSRERTLVKVASRKQEGQAQSLWWYGQYLGSNNEGECWKETLNDVKHRNQPCNLKIWHSREGQ